jgi:hypothetical protein
MKQLQAKNNSEWIRVNIDKTARHNIDRIHVLSEQLLGIRISDSVLIRTALESLRLDFLQGMYQAVGEDKDKTLENATKFCDTMRKRLMKCALGEPNLWEKKSDF